MSTLLTELPFNITDLNLICEFCCTSDLSILRVSPDAITPNGNDYWIKYKCNYCGVDEVVKVSAPKTAEEIFEDQKETAENIWAGMGQDDDISAEEDLVYTIDLILDKYPSITSITLPKGIIPTRTLSEKDYIERKYRAIHFETVEPKYGTWGGEMQFFDKDKTLLAYTGDLTW